MITKKHIIRYLYLPLILFQISPAETHAQFNTLIFKKDFHLGLSNKNIQSLGDQNGDGYDDFLIYDCSENKSFIFFGGNPVDTIPKFIINSNNPPIAIIDLNGDHKKDIVYYDYPNRKVNIYFGGVKIDTVPDLIFNPPPGVTGFASAAVLKDFCGDGRSELVMFESFLPYSDKQFGSLYFYNTESKFDTIPYYSIHGDSTDSVRIYWIDSNGDINGDGKTDFTLSGYKTQAGVNHYFRSFYLGNSNWDLTPAVTYYQDEHLFDVHQMHIVPDLNKDGKDDIIIADYGFYPYYYQYAVLKGSFPLDTIPSFGLNTQNQGIDLEQMISLGDVNGDGFNDFMSNTFTIPHNIKLWLGGRKIHEVADKTWFGIDCINGGFADLIGAVGDINGDGVNDIAIGGIHCPSDCELGTLYIFAGDTSVHADTITSIKKEGIIPTGYKFNDPYPNPFNPSTLISWQSAIRSRVQIKLFDILGREVAVILNEERQPGNNKIELNAEKYKLTSGVYLLQLEIYDKGKILYKETKKLSFLK